MVNQHEISEYIANLPLRKSFGRGYKPDDVYDAICHLSSMYNQLLSEVLAENEELKCKMEYLGTGILVYEHEAEEKKEDNNLYDAKSEKDSIMTDKELKRLKRRDLLEILLEQSKEKDALRLQVAEKEAEIKRLNAKLQNRKIELEKAGTLAEASFQLNGVLEAAQKAADQYLDNIQMLHMKEEQLYTIKEKEVEERCEQMLRNTKEECEKLQSITQEQCKEKEKETEEKCQYLNQKAHEDVEAKWKDLSSRLEDFYQAHEGLKELLAFSKMI